jgi:gliding motility-associated-like protein
VSFTATAEGGLPSQRKIIWQKIGDTAWVEGEVTNWKVDSSYSILVRLTDACSPDRFDTVRVISIDTPSLSLSFIPEKGCEPLLVEYSIASDTSGMSIMWDMGDGTSYPFTPAFHLYRTAGHYKVRVNITNRITGCHSKINLPGEIEVFENPRAIMKVEPETTDLFHPEIIFIDLSDNTSSRRWFFKGIPVSGRNIYTHTFTDTGWHTLQLVAYSKEGCTDTTSGKVYIKEPFAVYVPNIFTPNRDGLNEPFKPLLMGVAEAPMQIYNRWGEKVFDGDALQGWDGTFKGKPCPPDVYVYMIQVKGKVSERRYLSGAVTLLK